MANDPELITPVLNLYCDLMAEIRIRYEAISEVSAGRGQINPHLGLEFCYLQLRLICELIALACLVAHGDVSGTRSGRLLKAFNAEFILSALSVLHPEFYPKPSEQVTLDGERAVRPITSGYLQKPDLLKLYAECHGVLHRGRLKTLGPRMNQAVSFKPIAAWCDMIVRLLNHHQMPLADGVREIWVVMKAEDGKPRAALMEEVTGLGAPGAEFAP
jgi:hypothetical protein